jgi:hypothetical protein
MGDKHIDNYHDIKMRLAVLQFSREVPTFQRNLQVGHFSEMWVPMYKTATYSSYSQSFDLEAVTMQTDLIRAKESSELISSPPDPSEFTAYFQEAYRMAINYSHFKLT